MNRQCTKKLEDSNHPLVNFTNHPSGNWPVEQIKACEVLGPVLDLSFPKVEPEADSDEIIKLAEKYLQQIIDLDPVGVLVSGEFSLCFAIVSMLQQKGIKAYCATTRRIATEVGQVKTSRFEFCRLREFPQLEDI